VDVGDIRGYANSFSRMIDQSSGAQLADSGVPRAMTDISAQQLTLYANNSRMIGKDTSCMTQ